MTMLARQLYYELLKLFARKRTYIGFGAFLAVEVLILAILRTRNHERFLQNSMSKYGLDLTHYYSGLTVAHMMVTGTVVLLGSLYLALVCGDIVAKEVEDGTMRMVLSRPITRVRVIVLKYLACVAYTCALTFFIVGTSLALGIAVKGWGGLFVGDSWAHVYGFFEGGPGLVRFALATGVLCLVLMSVSTLAFMFSCFNMKPASATILTLSFFLIDRVIWYIPLFEDIQDYLFTEHMGVWIQCFQQKIPWDKIGHSLLYLGAFDVVFVGIAAAHFFRRDFKS